MMASFICSCGFLTEELGLCKVNFYVDGELYDTKVVTVGQTVKEPKTPTKENEIFVSWGTQGPNTYKYDFSTKVVTNMDLHAHFVIDAVALTNMITTQTMKSMVTIENKCYNTMGGTAVETNFKTYQGSGVIVDISGGYCYVLTNHHVAEKIEGFTKQNLTIEDAWGYKYEAQIYRNDSKKGFAMSDEYDLALLYFKYNSNSGSGIEEIVMGHNPQVNDYVVALGAPGGLQNAITYGSALAYQTVNVGDDSSVQKVTFEVVVHNAPIDHGSSGGALLNTKGELVGINFAGYNDGVYGCAIPIEKVIEFMNLYVYE